MNDHDLDRGHPAHGIRSPSIVEEDIRRIADLYAVEKEARGKPSEERVVIRQERTRLIFHDLKVWLLAQLPIISGTSPLA